VQLDPTELDEKRIYNFMVSSILPRPIAWVSSVDADGRTNLAPFSYFMGVCCKPMTVLFCPVVGSADRPKKDTLMNIEQVPEFVVNVAQAHTVAAVNLSAAPFATGESEFGHAEVTALASTRVSPPRVEEASIAFECGVRDIIEISDQPGGGWVVLGNVLCVHVHDHLVDEETLRVDHDALAPVARLGGHYFQRPGEAFPLKRHHTIPDDVGSPVLRELRDELLAWVRANSQLGSAVEIGLDTPLFGDQPLLDSVAVVSLVLLIEERLGTMVEPEALLEGADPVTVRTVVEACASLDGTAA
jgi:flavin reductase (DIM6/NTAB) family NADH-FMN oxidoreductase RutF/acyl carrier protein